MDKSAFLRHLEEMLEIGVNSLTGSEELSDLEVWDSLAIISFVAMADDRYNAHVGGGRIAACTTVEDLYHLVNEKVGAPA